MNALKCLMNSEKQSHRDNPSHLDVICDNEEEVDLPVSAVPVGSSSILMSQTLQQLPPTIDSQPVPTMESLAQSSDMHIPIISPVLDTPPTHPPIAPMHPMASSQSPLTTMDWLALINKIQAGTLPLANLPLPFDSISLPVILGNIPLSTKIFTAETATFTLDSDPSALPDTLLQMALNKVFIPLSMLMTQPLTG